MNKQDYRRNGAFAPNNNKAMDLWDIFNSVTHNPNELLYRMEITTLDMIKSKIVINFNGENTTDHIDFNTTFWDTFGRCYCIHLKDHVLKLGVTKIDIITRMNTYIYFGHPGQFMYHTKTKVLYS